MIIVLLGASCSGKSIIQNELVTHHGFEKIISYTTRKPRKNERHGSDYYFTSNDIFSEMLDDDLFAEYAKYSQDRLYGTLKSDYVDTNNNKVVVLTPNGLRQIKQNCNYNKIFTILVESNLGTRMKRYIDRCGVDKFNFDDKNEIASRVERDFSMFLGLEREVDLVVYNNEESNIKDLTNRILDIK